MRCPVCETVDLLMTDRSGIEIDYCPSCRGVWLDRGELDKLIERGIQQELKYSNAMPIDEPVEKRKRGYPDPNEKRKRGYIDASNKRKRRYDDDADYYDDDDHRDRRYEKRRKRDSFLEEIFDIFD